MRFARPKDWNARHHHGMVTRFVETRMDLARETGFPVIGGRELDVVIP